jgi:RNA polymerase sigma-70 factor, ECF subfamily
MDEDQWLAERFEENRAHLRAVAYRMLGSLPEADDAVQDTWLRVSRAGTNEVENLRGWLTTIIARVCLNMLRSRNARRERSLDDQIPDPVVEREGVAQPDEEALLADSVGLALLVVLDTLSPAERLAFVLHDMFDLAYEEIAPMVDRTPVAARQLASRARRRVRGARIPAPDPDLARQREWSMPSSGRHAQATSMASSQCLTPTSCCGRTPVPGAQVGSECTMEPRLSPSRHAWARVLRPN